MPAAYAEAPMTFMLAGFDVDAPYGRVFQVDIPYARTPVERNPAPGEFGITWGGQREFVDRLVTGYDGRALDLAQTALALDPQQLAQLQQALLGIQMPIPLQAMPLQDCVDLAIFFIRTTAEAQRLTFGIRGVGGPIDVATITRREGLRFVQRKKVVGERLTQVTPVDRGPLE